MYLPRPKLRKRVQKICTQYHVFLIFSKHNRICVFGGILMGFFTIFLNSVRWDGKTAIFLKTPWILLPWDKMGMCEQKPSYAQPWDLIRVNQKIFQKIFFSEKWFFDFFPREWFCSNFFLFEIESNFKKKYLLKYRDIKPLKSTKNPRFFKKKYFEE